MSEPSSLYARVHLTEAALAAFEASAPAFPNQFDDWQAWLANKSYYGKITDAGIQAMNQENIPSVTKMLDIWLAVPHMNTGRQRYDAATQSWTLGIVQTSENYYDFILLFSWLRAIANYKDLPGEDFILSFPYLWGGPPEAYIIITPKSSRISEEIPPEVMAEASAAMEAILDELQAAFSGQDS